MTAARFQFHGVLKAACGFALLFMFQVSAHATQHLVAPGDDWQSLASKVRPGDEIILMPGRHRSASFAKLIGAENKPITIRGLDPNQASIIAATRQGLEIKSASNLILKDFTITDAKINGLCIGVQQSNQPSATILPDSPAPTPALSNPIPNPTNNPTPNTTPNPKPAPATTMPNAPVGLIQMRNLTILKTGPLNQRHGIVISNHDNVRIDGCTFEGWGGSAIELIACRDVAIDRCTFTGTSDHSQMQGIRIRARSERVSIVNCRMDNAGDRVVCVGGKSDLMELGLSTIAPPPTDPSPASPSSPDSGTSISADSLFEAARVQVEHCVIVGGKTSIALINAIDCSVRNNTIVRPRLGALSLLTEQADYRFSSGKRNIFGLNLIVWDAGALQRHIEVGEKVDVESFVLEQNLWWSGEPAEQQKSLGGFPGPNQSPQLLNVDPKIDGKHRALEPKAKGFGALQTVR